MDYLFAKDARNRRGAKPWRRAPHCSRRRRCMSDR